MSYTITLTKPHGADYNLVSYQDIITEDVWFTRLNAGGPLFNIKYYIDASINPTKPILSSDFWYDDASSNGGTIGVKWGIISSDGFPDVNAPGINPDLFAVPGDLSNFYSFSQMCVLLRAMIDESSKPISLVDPSGGNEWVLEDTNIADGTEMTYLENKDLACYIPAINQYFFIHILTWGYDGDTTIEYERTPLFYAEPICLVGGTPILTDEGYIEIENIKPGKNKINGRNIIAISQSISPDNELVCFEKDSLGLNIPSQKTIMTKEHKIFYNKELREAHTFIGMNNKIYNVPYDGEILYNVLLEIHHTMNVNNMIVETLHPQHKIARLLFKNSKVPYTRVKGSNIRNIIKKNI